MTCLLTFGNSFEANAGGVGREVVKRFACKARVHVSNPEATISEMGYYSTSSNPPRWCKDIVDREIRVRFPAYPNPVQAL